jgi:hypothetical protein
MHQSSPSTSVLHGIAELPIPTVFQHFDFSGRNMQLKTSWKLQKQEQANLSVA